MNKIIVKSIAAVLAGFLTVVVLSIGTDAILETVGVLPSAAEQATQGLYNNWLLLLALFYRTVYTVLGGYVTAILAPKNQTRHVQVLAILGTIGGILGIVAGWNLSAHWYPLAIAVLAYPSVWWGGKLRINQRNP